MAVFMHRPAQRNMPLKRRAGRAASRGEKRSPTRSQGENLYLLDSLQ